MTHRKHPAASLLGLLFFLLSVPAFASHLRGTTVSWQPTATPGVVQFTMQYAQRASAGCNEGPCAIGSTATVYFDYGDGDSDDVDVTVTSINSAEDYFSAVATFSHSYASAGPFVAAYEDCCRVSAIKSGAGQTIRLETTVTPFANPLNHPPVVSMPAILTVPLQASTGFQLLAADQDHDHLHFRLATAGEMYDTTVFSCTVLQPPGLTIDDAGVVTWDTTQITKAGCGFAPPVSGDLWTVQFMVEDLDGAGAVKSNTPVDIILKFVSSTEAAPALTFSNPGPITAVVGSPIAFTATGDDAAANARVTLNATGLPVGATATDTNQELIPTVVSTFNWTPTNTQAGTYLIAYTVTNDTLEQVLGSVQITVVNAAPPVLNCPAALTTQYAAPTPISLQVQDPRGEALTVTWSVDGQVAHTDTLAGTPDTTMLTLNQSFSTLGTHTVAITATNSDGVSSQCSTPVTVNKADQTILFASLPPLTYGDPDVTLIGSASSNLQVAFSAAGSCSLVNGAVHIIAAGSCTLSAAQSGNDDYTSAPTLVQQATVARKALSVVAMNATRLYGAANPTFAGIVSGGVSNDSIAAVYTSPATPSSLVGTYPIVPALSGAALPNYVVSTTNGTLTIMPGAPAKLVVSPFPTTWTAGSSPDMITAALVDAGGNLVTSATATVSLTVTGPSGFLQILAAPAQNGVASLNLNALVWRMAGTYTLAISSDGMAATVFTITVVPAAASQVFQTGLPSAAVVNTSPGLFRASVLDTYGNVATGFTGILTTTITGPDGFVRSFTAQAGSGVASVDLSSFLFGVSGAYTITTGGPDLAPATSMVSATPATQTIALPGLANTVFGASAIALPAISSAGLPVSYAITGPARLWDGSLVLTGAGTVTLTASQPGNASYNAASVTRTFTVAKAPSFVTLVGSAKVSVAGGTVSLVAQVNSAAGTPTGVVTFMDGATLLGQQTLGPSGMATLGTAALSVGLQNVTVAYAGDPDFAAAVSSAVNVTVQDFTLSAPSSFPSVLAPGETATVPVSLTPGSSGFASPIILSVSGLPTGARFSFFPAIVTPGSSPASSTLSVTTSGTAVAQRNKGREVTLALLLLGSPLGLLRRKKGMASLKRAWLLAFLLATSMLGMGGCGASHHAETASAKVYLVTVSATSGPLVHTSTLRVEAP